MMKRFGIGWPLDTTAGDGAYGLDLAVELARRAIRPVLLGGISGTPALDPLRRALLAPALDDAPARTVASTRASGPGSGTASPFPVLQTMGPQLEPAPAARAGDPEAAAVFFERVDFPQPALARAGQWPMLVTASSWAAQALRARGLANVVNAPPGIDLGLFHPAPRSERLADRFLVFSGGRIGDARAQDLVVAAFRVFHERHPESRLVCAWDVAGAADWRGLARSTHVGALPGAQAGTRAVPAWLAANGVPGEAAVVLEAPAWHQLPAVLRECRLAIFPDRCAGGPNLFARAALACGVPTILAANTGHLDLIGDHVWALRSQADLAARRGDPGCAGWGETALEELIDAMERAHARDAEAKAKGEAAARFMAGHGAARHVDGLLHALGRIAAGDPLPSHEPGETYGWGLCLHRAGRFEEAEAVYGRVLAHAPRHVGALADRGNVRRERDDLAGAEADFRAILEFRPGYPRALQSLGNVLRRAGRVDEALECLRAACVASDRPSAHWDLAFTLLLAGRYREAWMHFDHRHAALGLRRPDRSKPRWRGGPVTHGRLLVLDEQGLGDTLQFLRFIPRIPVAGSGRVIFAGKPATLSVARRILPADQVFSWDGTLPRSEAWVPLMSLPACLGVDTPGEVPPPAVDGLLEPARVARWRDRVRGDDTRPVVGLCWRGNPDFREDRLRSPGLAALRPVLDVPGLRFVALQVGPGRSEPDHLGLRERIDDLGADIEAGGPDVLDTLAVIASCDLVITSCTAVAHMTGLVGRPGRVLLAQRADWRWMLEREDTPWYPSLRLIRQHRAGDWQGVAIEAARQLEAWRDDRTGASSHACGSAS